MKHRLLICADHILLRDHIVLGERVMPGLAYIDLLYQVFRAHRYDFRMLELRNLAILRPLVVADGSAVALEIDAVELEAGHWSIAVSGSEVSALDTAAAVKEETRYVTAQMYQVAEPASFDSTDAAAALADASRVATLEEVHDRWRLRDVEHGQFMRARGNVYSTPEAVLVECSVSPSEADRSAGLMFHPALIVGCAMCAPMAHDLADQPESSRPSLPLFYESFRASALLQHSCYARIGSASMRSSGEVSHCTVEFFATDGMKVAELRNLASKSVRVPQWQRPRPSPGSREGGIEAHISGLLADRLNKPAGQIDPDVGYYELGVDSATLIELVDDISAYVGEPLTPTLLFEHTTVRSLAAHLRSRFGTPSAARADSTPPQATSPQAEGDIALIGMAGRFPGARNVAQLWENLKSGRQSVTEIPSSRWDWRAQGERRSPSGKPISNRGGFIDEVDCFDAEFFRVSPREAQTMDPQERLFLEVSWQAIEDAGYTPRTLSAARGRFGRNPVGVFAGVMSKDYVLIANQAVAGGDAAALCLSNAGIANRVSYFCNFHGPSLSLDTACSSSLLAVHLAVQSIRSGECDVALAGGVNLSLHPYKYIACGMLDMHSANGRCESFGDGGDGYVSGEGVGVVVLKSARRAIADNDHIYAVIKGTAANHGGTTSGTMVPSPVAQAAVINDGLAKAGVHPRTIGYVEAHGTGTALGDPIEIDGLTKAFRQHTDDTAYCAIGSIKSNIGHGESAAGVSGLIKAALQLRHRTLVPSLHAAQPSSAIDWDASPFFLQRETCPWKAPDLEGPGGGSARRAAVSSFGAGGANVHVVLEEGPERPTVSAEVRGPEAPPCVVPLAARNSAQLREQIRAFADFLKRAAADPDARRDLNLRDLAYTLQGVGEI